jgi:hypothetical protein
MAPANTSSATSLSRAGYSSRDQSQHQKEHQRALRTPRILPAAILFIAALGIVFLAACGGDGDAAEQTATTTGASSATATRSATTRPSTATPTATSTPTAIPTPTPYNGDVTNIRIPRLGMNAPVEHLDVADDGQMAAPSHGRELTHVGWYYEWDKPGRLNPDNRGWTDYGGKTQVSGFYGNSVFSAHVYYNLGVPAPFVRLASAAIGDEVIITMEDGREYTYTVFAKEQYHRDNYPGAQVAWPPNKPDNEEWVTLITCGGALDSTGLEYLYRDVVIAKRSP